MNLWLFLYFISFFNIVFEHPAICISRSDLEELKKFSLDRNVPRTNNPVKPSPFPRSYGPSEQIMKDKLNHTNTQRKQGVQNGWLMDNDRISRNGSNSFRETESMSSGRVTNCSERETNRCVETGMSYTERDSLNSPPPPYSAHFRMSIDSFKRYIFVHVTIDTCNMPVTTLYQQRCSERKLHPNKLFKPTSQEKSSFRGNTDVHERDSFRTAPGVFVRKAEPISKSADSTFYIPETMDTDDAYLIPGMMSISLKYLANLN